MRKESKRKVKFINSLFLACIFAISFWAPVKAETKWAIQPVYEYAHDFSDGLAAVRKDGLWGYIDKTGKIVIPLQYKEVTDFIDGYATVNNTGKERSGRISTDAIIDKTGKIVLQTDYDYIANWGNEMFSVSGGAGSGVIRLNGEFILPLDKYDRISCNAEMVLFQYSSATGAVVLDIATGKRTQTNYRVSISFDPQDGYSIIYDGDYNRVFIDKTGTPLFPGKFIEANDFRGGWACVLENLGNDVYAERFINRKGETVYELPDGYRVYAITGMSTEPMRYQYGEKLIVVEKADGDSYSAHVIDRTGKTVLPSQEDKEISIVHADGKDYINVVSGYGFNAVEEYYDDNGNPVEAVFYNGMGLVESSDHKYGFVSESGAAPVPEKQTPALTANPTASTVLVNGKNVAFDAYNINDNNYFKLRDIAFILNGTEKQFEVGWDGANNAISLTSGKPYTAAVGEMSGKAGGAKTPIPTDSKILLDGKDASFTAYNIDGNNYFKLRDIGEAFNFGVDWDGEKNTIVIDTSKGYGDESKTDNSAGSGSSNYTYLKNFPTVPYFLSDLGLEPDKIKLVEDTKELVVYTIDFRGFIFDPEEENIHNNEHDYVYDGHFSLTHETFYNVLEDEGFEDIPYNPSEDDSWYKYTMPGDGYDTIVTAIEKDGVLAAYIMNGSAKDIDAFIVTNMK